MAFGKNLLATPPVVGPQEVPAGNLPRYLNTTHVIARLARPDTTKRLQS